MDGICDGETKVLIVLLTERVAESVEDRFEQFSRLVELPGSQAVSPPVNWSVTGHRQGAERFSRSWRTGQHGDPLSGSRQPANSPNCRQITVNHQGRWIGGRGKWGRARSKNVWYMAGTGVLCRKGRRQRVNRLLVREP
ncbi:MAG: hypothetical protein Ct9H300mP1_14860 [Planctomycetaceae bacterium]|nr:MAG: hypothetical protein Ct9H300mP1_14860 [Planctomycetaceae bacterium]